MYSNIKLRIYKLMPSPMLVLLTHVIGKMTGNVLFPDPPVSLAEMSILRAEFDKAILNAIGGSIEAREVRNNKVKEVQQVLSVTANYVRSRCGGDAAKLASSGFELRKVPVPITAIDIPRRVTAIASDSPGTVLLRWGKTEGARMFRVERAITDPILGDPVWTFVVMTSRQRYLASGQEPYRPYWFRVIALGKEKEGLPSDVVLGRAV